MCSLATAPGRSWPSRRMTNATTNLPRSSSCRLSRSSIRANPRPGPRRTARGTKAFIADGQAINSGDYNGLATSEMKRRITADLQQHGLGREAKNFKLRDWLFSRQRFWGEPFPILHELDDAGKLTGRYRAVPVEQLPVKLPELADFKPHGRPEPPLEKADESWLYVTLDGKRYKRETNTMPQWAGSCWYFLRYIDKANETRLVDPELEKAWMPVDLYIGGAEHAVLHLLYSRFWHLVLFDRGHVSTSEPFTKLVNQGMILGEAEYHLAHPRSRLNTTMPSCDSVSWPRRFPPRKKVKKTRSFSSPPNSYVGNMPT